MIQSFDSRAAAKEALTLEAVVYMAGSRRRDAVEGVRGTAPPAPPPPAPTAFPGVLLAALAVLEKRRVVMLGTGCGGCSGPSS